MFVHHQYYHHHQHYHPYSVAFYIKGRKLNDGVCFHSLYRTRILNPRLPDNSDMSMLVADIRRMGGIWFGLAMVLVGVAVVVSVTVAVVP